MPRFSVIVPVHNVQAYLHECMDSVLSQSFTDFELIAVDDHSPDGSGAVLDAYAAADARVTVLHLPENVGLGRSRNLGSEYASGDYLVYLDSDDTLTPGALRAVADRLEATGDPEVLVFDHARTYWDGVTAPNARADLVAQGEGPGVFRLEERPELLKLLAVAWNKVYRHDFVRREGLTFPPGYYEDTPWTFPALLTARSVTTLDRVCVHYRQRRSGSILSTPSRKHFDVFEQYDRLFAFLDGRPELERWRPVLYRRMADHFTVIHNDPVRLPRAHRAEFLRRGRAYCRRYRAAPAATCPKQPVRLRLRRALVRLGSHRTMRLLSRASRICASLLARARTLRVLARKAALRAHYALQRRRPLDPGLAVFSAYWNRGYSCNPAAIEAKVRELAPHIRTAWVTTPEYAHTLPPGVTRLHPGSPGFWSALARAGYLVSNVNQAHGYVKRPGQKLLQTHHGTPLKHMGLDLRHYPAGADGMDFGKLLERTDHWDFSLSSNPHSTLVWERAYPSTYTTLEFGYPRNDVFQRATAADVARLRARLGVPESAVAVLYAPTHRDYRRGWHPQLDPARLARTLGPDFVLLVRAHYFHADPASRGSGTSEALPEAVPDGLIDVSGHPSVEELCLASDVLVTDYSSLMFDYANLDRPLVLHTPDWETYRAARGTYFDITATPPGPITTSEEELADVLATGAYAAPHSRDLRAAFRERFCPFDDGLAAERVVRHLFLGEPLESLPPFLPPADRTPAPAAALAPAPAPAPASAGPASPSSPAPTPSPEPPSPEPASPALSPASPGAPAPSAAPAPPAHATPPSSPTPEKQPIGSDGPDQEPQPPSARPVPTS
ncbi:bifunctional glycosyltransferase/CDP-glycerol:glycerophosphate glycerophosphotransferase [Streptomyces iconiensis]|uniref:CDP-glycerol glycerophosphotransferase family protein n=1 Tax=Streptomyces iconiensis TaxID=1384038 RepID=A0ABT7A8C8_9ACTN|nr:bifunctional glycosyltransferase/CDP-glycerol:glycerophosphate glycerophosphotransferase [Streptomyces iconiensis]MDJ1137596.1 CDP-glycerol glycerophosphotransferase family protein [Streptomyces iconiensis]